MSGCWSAPKAAEAAEAAAEGEPQSEAMTTGAMLPLVLPSSPSASLQRPSCGDASSSQAASHALSPASVS